MNTVDQFKQIAANFKENKIVKILKPFGKVFLVGGYIRDIIGNETPKDIDLFLETRYMNDFIDIVEHLKKAKFQVKPFIKTDYDDLFMENLMMASIYDPVEDKHYDLVIGESITQHTMDFNVNGMFCYITAQRDVYEPGTLYLPKLDQDDNILVQVEDSDLAELTKFIKNKQLITSYDVSMLDKNSKNVYGAKRLLKRFSKRLNYGWTLVNIQQNIDVAVYLLNNIYPNMYRRSMDRHEAYLTLINLMNFLMTAGYDLRSFINQQNWNFPNQRRQESVDYKKVHFSNFLNHIANKYPRHFDFNKCMELMDYCDTKYIK